MSPGLSGVGFDIMNPARAIRARERAALRLAADAPPTTARGRESSRSKAAALCILTLLVLTGFCADAHAQDVWRNSRSGRIVDDYPYQAEPDPGHFGRSMRIVTDDFFYRDE